MAAGRLTALHRWPVKSMAGERPDALSLDRFGVTGDRAHAVFELSGGHAAPRQRGDAAAAAGLVCGLPAGVALTRETAPQPVVTDPGGTARSWEDPELPEALAGDLGRPIALVGRALGQQNRPTTVRVTVEASRRALEAALGAPSTRAASARTSTSSSTPAVRRGALDRPVAARRRRGARDRRGLRALRDPDARPADPAQVAGAHAPARCRARHDNGLRATAAICGRAARRRRRGAQPSTCATDRGPSPV
jgi:hypothetical protein